jgi:SAM-dependent methyltransferase
MEQQDRYQEAMIEWYRARLDRDDNVRILSSGNDVRREIRFDVLRGLGIDAGSSVLDLGCGLADFYAYLKRNGVDVSYTGVEIVPEFVERARAAHPDATILQRDILKEPFAEKSFDFVVCSQVFNLRFAELDNEKMARTFLAEMYRVARRGLACDFVTSYVDFREDYLHYYDPGQLFAYAKSLSKRVVLRHDYPLFEFCLYVFPDFAGWGGAKKE